MSGQEAVAKLLLEYTRVDPDLKDSDGFSSLSLAASNGHETLVKLLLETERVDADCKASDGST